jgi:Fe-S oxidoreductase
MIMERINLTKLQSEDVTSKAASCVAGAPPPCARECPFGLDTRSFAARAENGRWQAAYKTYRDAVVFPEIVSRLCPAPCDGACPRADSGGTVNLRGIERTAVAQARDKRRDSYAIPQKAGSAAVVGAGPSGLSAALSLVSKRYSVTVFERETAWGGSLRGLPEFDIFDAEFALSFARLDARFEFGREISSLAELDGFGAVYLATGAGGEDFGLLRGFDPALLTTPESRVFLGGGLAGAELMTSISHGRLASRSIEAYLQVGRVSPAAGASCALTPDTSLAIPSPRVVPSDASGEYTDGEARAEASRCLKCDCDICARGCEMLRRFHKLPMKIAMEVFTDIRANPPYSSHTITREAYSCNNCGHCKRNCPESIDVGELLRFSRRARVEAGSAPPALHDFWLREMRFSSGDAGFYSPCNEKGTCEYVFFPGCQLGAYDPRHVLRSFSALRSVYDTGIFLGCCGAPAYWAGEDDMLEASSAAIRAAWDALGEPVFVFACPTCASLFAELFPEIEGLSLYELLLASGAAPAPPKRMSAAVFDPCSAASDEGVRAAVRAIAERAGAELTELPETGKCCGYGGHMMLANPSLYGEITESRASASELPYIVYCANCRAVFASRGKECIHALDAAFDLSPAPIADIDTRRRNSLEVKRLITREFSTDDAENSPLPAPWDDIRLTIAPETAERADRKLISLSDIREALYLARETGGFFAAPSGVRQCSMIRPALVYWVTYKPTDDGGFEVLDAYYHRMKFGGGETDG